MSDQEPTTRTNHPNQSDDPRSGASQPSPSSSTAPPGAGLDALTAALDRTKQESTTDATKAMLAELGFDDLKAAQAQLAKWREADDARKDDLTKATETVARLERERDAAVAQAASTTHTARVERALLAKGAQAAQVQRLVRLVDVTADGSDAEVAAAVDALVAEFPAGFGHGSGAPSGVSGAQPPQQQSSGDAMKAGEDRWRREQERAPKFSVRRGNAS
ncbi:MAG: hypothetical protein J2P16_00100 [Mycobacterium sp.]|nr:hypothetical protein [Mycobacterium sp.]